MNNIMAKEQEQTQETLEQQAQQEEQQPTTQQEEATPIDKLLKEGEVTLTANSREAIYAQSKEFVDTIPEGTTWTRPAVEYDPATGLFSQKYNIVKK